VCDVSDRQHFDIFVVCVFLFQWLRVFNIFSSVHSECQRGRSPTAAIVSLVCHTTS